MSSPSRKVEAPHSTLAASPINVTLASAPLSIDNAQSSIGTEPAIRTSAQEAPTPSDGPKPPRPPGKPLSISSFSRKSSSAKTSLVSDDSAVESSTMYEEMNEAAMRVGAPDTEPAWLVEAEASLKEI